MTTKKQKRLLGEARQAENRAEAIASGLAAQKKDQARRAKQKAEREKAEKEKAEKENKAKAAVSMAKMSEIGRAATEKMNAFATALNANKS